MDNSSHFYSPYCEERKGPQVEIDSGADQSHLFGTAGLAKERDVFIEDKLAGNTAFDTSHQESDAFQETGGKQNSATPLSEFDEIAQEAEMLVAKKMNSNCTWSKKLVDAIAAYTKTLEEVHSEYSRIQDLEHKEAERLDQVEPDVHGATSHVLAQSSLFASGGADSMSASFTENEKTSHGIEEEE